MNKRSTIHHQKESALEKEMTTDFVGSERRCGEDRRGRNRWFMKQWFGKGKRKSSRRATDRKRIVVFDQYPPSLLVGTLLVLILSLLDAMFTLVLLSEGARELNPVMRYYLNQGPTVFILVKYGFTVLSVMIIVISYEAIIQRYQVGSKILPLFATLFGAVVIWELYLLSII